MWTSVADTQPASLSAAPYPVGDLAACNVSEPLKIVINVFGSVADSIEWVHTSTGLPWWLSIPLTTIGLKLLLVPLSLKQAKLVRQSYGIYKEAHTLAKSQVARQASSLGPKNTAGLGDASKESKESATVTEQVRGGGGLDAVCYRDFEQVQDTTVDFEQVDLAAHTISIFQTLRKKCGSPNPLWIFVNPLIQAPVMILTTMTLRQMSNVPWPGFQTEGALWFPDLCEVALELDSVNIPMGPPGFILQLTLETQRFLFFRPRDPDLTLETQI
eukprot:gene16751-23024_t